MKLAVRRIVAYTIDVSILFVVLAPLGIVVQWLIGTSPQTGPQIWLTIILNFSIPCWLYFIFSDLSAGGATVGKWIMGIRTVSESGAVSVGQAVGRTAVKLLPWEMVHISVFALAERLGEFSVLQWVGLAMVDALIVVYLVAVFVSRGRRGVHDVVARSSVRLAV